MGSFYQLMGSAVCGSTTYWDKKPQVLQMYPRWRNTAIFHMETLVRIFKMQQ